MNKKKNKEHKKWKKEQKKITKQSIRREFKIGLKEEFMFASGLIIGILSGIIGNFFVVIYFRWYDKLASIESFLFTGIAFVFMIGFFLFWIWKILRNMKKEYWELVENKDIKD